MKMIKYKLLPAQCKGGEYVSFLILINFFSGNFSNLSVLKKKEIYVFFFGCDLLALKRNR